MISRYSCCLHPVLGLNNRYFIMMIQDAEIAPQTITINNHVPGSGCVMICSFSYANWFGSVAQQSVIVTVFTRPRGAVGIESRSMEPRRFTLLLSELILSHRKHCLNYFVLLAIKFQKFVSHAARTSRGVASLGDSHRAAAKWQIGVKWTELLHNKK